MNRIKKFGDCLHLQLSPLVLTSVNFGPMNTETTRHGHHRIHRTDMTWTSREQVTHIGHEIRVSSDASVKTCPLIRMIMIFWPSIYLLVFKTRAVADVPLGTLGTDLGHRLWGGGSQPKFFSGKFF